MTRLPVIAHVAPNTMASVGHVELGFDIPPGDSPILQLAPWSPRVGMAHVVDKTPPERESFPIQAFCWLGPDGRSHLSPCVYFDKRLERCISYLPVAMDA